MSAQELSQRRARIVGLGIVCANWLEIAVQFGLDAMFNPVDVP